jgi:prepilin-type N-terminal cleavage/methylation domain-containing protein
MKYSSKIKKHGFTLIEVIISISIITILLGISMTVFRALTDQQSLDRDVETAISYLLRARNQTITGENNNTYGVYFASTSVTLFEGTSYAAGSSTNLVFNFNNRTYRYSIALTGGANHVYFKKISGAPHATGTVTYRSSGMTNKQKLIQIYASGLVEVQ